MGAPPVTPLRAAPTVAQDIPAALRRLADSVEADIREGRDVRAVGVATLTGNRVTTFGYGRDGNIPEIMLMFQHAIQAAARGYD